MDGFGERLIAARERKGYNQREFAEALGITPTRLNYWEKNKREPDFFMFSKILSVLSCDANELLGIQISLVDDKKTEPFLRDEGIALYEQLDEIDKAEIRGEMRQMLKSDKYKQETAQMA